MNKSNIIFLDISQVFQTLLFFWPINVTVIPGGLAELKCHCHFTPADRIEKATPKVLVWGLGCWIEAGGSFCLANYTGT